MISFWIFYPWILSRGTINDQAIIERSIYNQTGIEIIKSNWLIGTGAGTNMFHMTQNLQNQLDSWNIQPIHNYWLILISEFGITGLIIMFFILITYYKALKYTITSKKISNDIDNPTSDNWSITLSTIAISLFTLFWFDHYFYTYWPGQILLALVIALMWKQIKTDNHNI